jgi:hypothetical protein
MAPVPAGAARDDQLRRCDGLSQAMRWREAALGRGAEIRPTVAVESQLGAPPSEAERLVLWRRAATAIEGHRDRWALPDRPLALGASVGRDAGMGRDTGMGRQAGGGRQAGEGRQGDERRVLAAVRAFEQARDLHRGLLPSGP